MSKLQHIKEIIEKGILPNSAYENDKFKYYNKKNSKKKNEAFFMTKPRNESPDSLSSQLFSIYNEAEFINKVDIIKTIIESANYVFYFNHKRTSDYHFLDSQKLKNSQEFPSEYYYFWDLIYDDKDLEAVFDKISETDINILFILLLHHDSNNESKIYYLKMINMICNKSFVEKLPLFDFLKLWHDVENNNHSGESELSASQHLIDTYFSFLNNAIPQLCDLYFKSSTYKLDRKDIPTLTSYYTEKLILKYFNNGTINKIDFFEPILKKSFIFNNEDISYSIWIRELCDQDIATFYYENLYNAIPDNYYLLKEDRGLGIHTTIKLLSEIDETKNDPVIQLLRIITSGNAKIRFINHVKQYGAINCASHFKIFEEKFPKIYKSAFLNKNPIVLNKNKPESIACFEQVMMYRVMTNNTVTKGKKRI